MDRRFAFFPQENRHTLPRPRKVQIYHCQKGIGRFDSLKLPFALWPRDLTGWGDRRRQNMFPQHAKSCATTLYVVQVHVARCFLTENSCSSANKANPPSPERIAKQSFPIISVPSSSSPSSKWPEGGILLQEPYNTAAALYNKTPDSPTSSSSRFLNLTYLRFG